MMTPLRQRGERRCSSGHKSRQNRLVPDMPPLQLKVGLLYFTDGAIREFFSKGRIRPQAAGPDGTAVLRIVLFPRGTPR
jgi:hypothetical protein